MTSPSLEPRADEPMGCTPKAHAAALSFERVSLIAAAVLVAAALGGAIWS